MLWAASRASTHGPNGSRSGRSSASRPPARREGPEAYRLPNSDSGRRTGSCYGRPHGPPRTGPTDPDPDVVLLHALLLGEKGLKLIAFRIAIAAAVLDHAMGGLTGLHARAQRILVGVDEDGVGRDVVDPRQLRQGGLVEERHRHRAPGHHGSDTAEIPARKAAFHKVVFLFVTQYSVHKPLLKMTCCVHWRGKHLCRVENTLMVGRLAGSEAVVKREFFPGWMKTGGTGGRQQGRRPILICLSLRQELSRPSPCLRHRSSSDWR